MDASVNRPLEGRVALVTGAGGGIGRDLACALGAAGAHVGIAVRRIETGEETANLISAEGGPRSLVIRMDMTDHASIAAGVAALAGEFGAVDIIIQNAAAPDSAYPMSADVTDEVAWRRQADITLGGTLVLAQAGHPHLKASGQGRFIVMTSNFGYHGAAMNAIYSTTKASLRGFIKSLAREWGPDRITVNAISPAAATPPTRVFFSQYPAMEAAYRRKFALGTLGDPRRDIGEGAVALCAGYLGFMTGQTLFLDGGLFPSA
ncbi:SDR family NAD(P)-dependent oxidoreductase [uncultured Sphingomonas sp.]|uniref:SDR family NAD(P)-dependent oxidoreductase n=1 Tax=uncultured Sphingomonas sp. TaxID=158754 RepID=UPI0025DD85A1|nr:SDR family oxidoreductase [uncultured Sphingomonas sp.]